MTKPQTIGNFQLLRTLGEGGMGVVFEAEHVNMHRRAAIKVLRPELMRDEKAIRRFFNEARATNEVRHPGIVQIYDCGTREDDGSPWLIMELLEGETLTRRIARLGRLPTADVVLLGSQTASVLEAAHRAGIIHRDLKPDNLFIVNNQETPSGERIKVLDFGIAKLSSLGAMKSMHTQTGMLMGTPLYMSPEQCRGVGNVDARSDVYSLGLILYEMVAGELPFVSEGMGELFDMQMNRPPPPLEDKVPGVAPALAAVISRALRKDPGERFQTMAELQRVLGEVVSAPQPPTVVSAPAPIRPVVVNGPVASPERALPVSSTTLSGSATAVDETFELPRTRSARPWLIAGVVLLLAGGGAVALRSLARDRDQGSQAAVVATKPAPPAPAASPPAGPAAATATPAAAPAKPVEVKPVERAAVAPSAPSRVTVDLRTAPSEARVVDAADGRLIGVTPLHELRDRADGPWQVRIEKPGYVSRIVGIPQKQDYRGTIRLERAGGGEAREPREPREAPSSGGEHIIKL